MPASHYILLHYPLITLATTASCPAGITLHTSPIPHQGELSALAAAFPLVTLQAGLGHLLLLGLLGLHHHRGLGDSHRLGLGYSLRVGVPVGVLHLNAAVAIPVAVRVPVAVRM